MDHCGRVIVEATVVSIGDGPFYYRACRQCYSKLVGHIENFCPKCRNVQADTEENQRYRLHLTISDGLSLMKVTIFGNVLAPYFGCSAIQFHRWSEQTTPRLTPLLVNCALEKTMVGSSLLFGFKGSVRKPNGTRVTLKDIERLCHSNASNSARNRDPVAFQILPQNECQYPIPVMQHLQNLYRHIEADEHDFDIVNMNSDTVLKLLSDINNTNDVMVLTQEEIRQSFPVGEDKDGDHIDCDVTDSRLLLSSAENETSIGLSMTSSTPGSFDISEAHSFTSNITYGEAKSSNRLISSQTQKSSWCVKKWLKKNKFNAIDKNAHISRFANEFPSPELARDVVANSSPSNFISNFSSADILSPLSDYDIPVKEALDINRINREKRKLLTLKSNIDRVDSLDDFELSHINVSLSTSNKDIVNRCIGEGTSFSKCFGTSNVKDTHLSFVEIPESEDFDLFVAAIDSERPQIVQGMQQSIIDTDTLQSSSKKCDKLNIHDKDLSPCQTSFQYMPESEDLDLFIAALNVEQLQLDPEPKESVKVDTVNDDKDSYLEIRGFSKSNQKKSNFTPKRLFPLTSNNSDSKGTGHTGPKKTFKVPSFLSQIDGDDEAALDRFCQLDESCDLFESSAQSQSPCNFNATQDKFENICNSHRYDNNTAMADNKNYSLSLFSSSPSPSQQTNSPSHSCNVRDEVVNQSKCDYESFIDLFSPSLCIESPVQTSAKSFASSYKKSVCYDSPDLFLSSQESH